MSQQSPIQAAKGAAKVDALIKQRDGKRAVAKVSYGPFRFGSIWIMDVDTPTPKVSWPKTARGYNIVECVDASVRSTIETEILERLATAS